MLAPSSCPGNGHYVKRNRLDFKFMRLGDPFSKAARKIFSCVGGIVSFAGVRVWSRRVHILFRGNPFELFVLQSSSSIHSLDACTCCRFSISFLNLSWSFLNRVADHLNTKFVHSRFDKTSFPSTSIVIHFFQEIRANKIEHPLHSNGSMGQNGASIRGVVESGWSLPWFLREQKWGVKWLRPARVRTRLRPFVAEFLSDVQSSLRFNSLSFANASVFLLELSRSLPLKSSSTRRDGPTSLRRNEMERAERFPVFLVFFRLWYTFHLRFPKNIISTVRRCTVASIH